MPRLASTTLPHNLRSATRLAPAPDYLDPPEQALFRQIIAEFEINDASSVSLLVTAMECHMRARRARERVDEDGECIKDRFGATKAHPMIAVERDSRDAYLRTMRVLNLKPSNGARKP